MTSAEVFQAEIERLIPKAESGEQWARICGLEAEMLAALKASEEEYRNLDEDAPQDAGCIECTMGTVPNHLNTGLCAHHMRVAVIRKIEARS